MDESSNPLLPIRANKDKGKIKNGLLIKYPQFKEIVKTYSLPSDYGTIITLEMAMELAQMLKIADVDAFTILITIGKLFGKRLLEGKTCVIHNMMHTYLRRDPKRDKIRLKSVISTKVKKLIAETIFLDLKPMTEKRRRDEKLKIINMISESKDLETLLFLIFGYPRHKIQGNASQLPKYFK